jgi:hypothetical protein
MSLTQCSSSLTNSLRRLIASTWDVSLCQWAWHNVWKASAQVHVLFKVTILRAFEEEEKRKIWRLFVEEKKKNLKSQCPRRQHPNEIYFLTDREHFWDCVFKFVCLFVCLFVFVPAATSPLSRDLAPAPLCAAVSPIYIYIYHGMRVYKHTNTHTHTHTHTRMLW